MKKLRWKSGCGILMLLLGILFCPFGAHAKEYCDITLHTEEQLHAGKAFWVYVDLFCDAGISAAEFSLQYESDQVSLNSAELTDKSSDDFFHFYDQEGVVAVSFSAFHPLKAKQTVRFRFAPLQKDRLDCQFLIRSAQACRNTTDLLSVSELPSLSLSVTSDAVQVSSSAGSKNSSSSQSSRKQSRNSQSDDPLSNSRDSRNSEVFSAVLESTEWEDPALSGNEQDPIPSGTERHVYEIQDSKDNSSFSDQTQFLYLIGIILFTAAAVFFAYQAGARRMRDKQYRDAQIPPDQKDDSRK